MLFVETPTFTRQASELWTDEELLELQLFLAETPDAGTDLGRGLYKLRWGVGSRGKRGGARVIYLFRRADRIVLAFAYAKADQPDLTPAQRAALLRALADD